MKDVYDVQVSERGSDGIPRLRTFGTSTSRNHIRAMLADIRNLSSKRRLCRVLKNRQVLSDRETRELDHE